MALAATRQLQVMMSKYNKRILWRRHVQHTVAYGSGGMAPAYILRQIETLIE